MAADPTQQELEAHQKLCKKKHTGSCRGCPSKVLWARNIDTGMLIPLDPKALVYKIVAYPENPFSMEESIRVVRVKDAFVTHFATCKRPEDFSSSKKK